MLFVQGGASQQFAAVPLNLMHTGKADYIVTGNFAKKAWQEGKIYGEARVIASSEDKTYTYIPDVDKIAYNDDADYVHITSNNTIFGTRYAKFPENKGAAGVRHELGDPLPRSGRDQFGVIYAGAQKNLAPAGVTIVIARRDLIENPLPNLPHHAQMENAGGQRIPVQYPPPCFAIYMANLVLRHLKKQGGVKAINEINVYKAGLLYDFIDSSSFYTNNVVKEYRSIMNVPFVTPSRNWTKNLSRKRKPSASSPLKGHRLVGGMRASIYNAMPVEGVKKLVEFMKKFELENA